jgi:peptidoglycan hydrolase-like protein with peptidoglycan-binding domain
MALTSRTFKGDNKLEACLVNDAAHITKGATGDHVGKIQNALMILDGAKIDPGEVAGKLYGSSTAAAVLAYKTKRKIINFTYQSKADDIVGKMTIATLDREMLHFERATREVNSCSGKRDHPTFR